MAASLEDLLKYAATEAAEPFDPNFVLAKHLPYTTQGTKDRLSDLKTLLACFYRAVQAQDWGVMKIWCDKLRFWELLEFNIPREVRATLAAIVYNLAFAPGTPPGMDELNWVFGDLTWDKKRVRYHIDASRDMTLHKKLDWEQMIERLKSLYLGFENNIVQEAFDPFGILFHAQVLLDPQDRMAILQSLLPFVDTAHPDTQEGAQVAKLISVMIPTAPAPKSCPNCQPAAILPMLFHLFAMQKYGYRATAHYIQLFSRFTTSHLKCDHVSFGPYGIYDAAQSDTILKAISRLMLLDDKEGGKSFYDPPIPGSAPCDRWEKRATLAVRIAEWIVNSLSPMCETQQSSMFSGLESLVDSVCQLYHPEAEPPDMLFVARILIELVNSFSLRYYGEQTGELETPPARRLSPALKRQFVLLLRRPLFLGAFSQRMGNEGSYRYPISSLSHESLQALADLESDLIIPAALKSFYVSQNSKVDGEAAYLSLSLLQRLSSIMVQKKGLRCHAPFLMELACVGIHPNNPKLTTLAVKFVKTIICSFPWLPLAEKSKPKSKSDSSVDAEVSIQWAMREMDRLCDTGAEVEVAYRQELSDDYESALLRSAAIHVTSFARKFLENTLDFLEQAYSTGDPTLNSASQDDYVLDDATSSLTEAACECLRLLTDMELEQSMKKIATNFSSTPLPRATDYVATILETATLQHPDGCLAIFVPELIEKVKEEVANEWEDASRRHTSLLSSEYNLHWYARLLARCLRLGGVSNLRYEKKVLDMVKSVEKPSILRASTVLDPLISRMLAGLAGTYAARYKVVSADFAGISSDGWGWDQVKTEIIWHEPSRDADSLSAAYEIFDARLSCHEEEIRRLMSEYPWKEVSERKDGLQRLADALNGAAGLFCSAASLLDPQLASNRMDSSHGGALDVVGDEATRVAWQTRDMQPNLRNANMHRRRSSTARLGAEVNKHLADHREDSNVCFEALMELFATLVGDVGTCQVHRGIGTTREDRGLWAYDFHIPMGIPPRYPPAFRILDLNHYHREVQNFATSCRGMGDVEEATVAALVDGCCSPFESVARKAQYLLKMTHNTVTGFARHFLPPMLTKTKELVEKYNPSSDKSHRHIAPNILNALTSLLEEQVQRLEKPIFWSRDCPSSVPELVRLLMKAIEKFQTQHDDILKLALNGLRHLEQSAVWESRSFSDLRCAGAIRPAEEDPEAIQKACKSREAYRADIATEMQAVGLQMLEKAKDQRYYFEFARSIFVGFAQKSHPDEYVSELANGVISGDIKVRDACTRGFTDLIRVCLAKQIHGDDLEAYVRTQGRTAFGLVKVNPRGDTHQINSILEQFGEMDSTDVFVDNVAVGSLVWSEFKALSVNPPRTTMDSETLERLGARFTRDWFHELVQILQQVELTDEAEEQGMDRGARPTVVEDQVNFLACVFTLMGHGKTAAVLDDIKSLVPQALGTGSNIGDHTGTATLLAALLLAPTSGDFRRSVLDFATPTVVDILEHKLTPEGKDIWNHFLALIFQGHDPRRYPDLVRYIVSLRLDSSSTAFQNECRLMALHVLVDEWGWRLSHDQPILDNLLTHMKGKVQSVAASVKMGSILADADKRRFRTSAPDVKTLVLINKAASSLGLPPYTCSADLKERATQIWETVARLRQETPSDATSHSDSYMHACFVGTAWLHRILVSSASTMLVPLLPCFLDELFHMLDIRHAEEKIIRDNARSWLIMLSSLQFSGDDAQAYLQAVLERAWRGLDGSMIPGVAPGRADTGNGEDDDMVNTYRDLIEKRLDLKVPELLLRILSGIQQNRSHENKARTISSTVRARRTAMGMLRMFYLRRLLSSDAGEQQLSIQLAVWTQTLDAHLDIRGNAYVTLKDMLSRSRLAVASEFAQKLINPSKEQLKGFKSKMARNGGGGAPQTKEVRDALRVKEANNTRRYHIGVLWLAIVFTSFPHVVHPETWMIEAAEALSRVAASRDSSIVGQDAREFLQTFQTDRRTNWDALKEKFLSENLLQNLTDMMGSSSYA